MCCVLSTLLLVGPRATIVGSLADGLTYGQIRAADPQLANEDMSAALAYALNEA